MRDQGDQAIPFTLAACGAAAGRSGDVSLADLTERGPALIVFVEEDCPTSRMTLERIEVLRPTFDAAGASLVAIHQDVPEVAVRTMRRCHANYTALVEPAPYATADAYGVATVPTSFLVAGDGTILEAIEGWCSEDFNRVAVRVAEHAGDVEAAKVTDDAPLMKPGCASKNTLDPELLRAADRGDAMRADFDEVEDMFERGWTDGLPVVPPTRERVERMLGEHDPASSLGQMPPGMGELTLERLAACAVLAGCRPSYFDVVLAGTQAMLEPAFNVHGMTNTTHTCGVVAIVNGPVRERIGMNSGINAMGGWNRANATIGRALRLVIGLTGQGRPGTLDRSTLGQPGKISFCFAENEEVSPWEPLSVTRGFEPGTSTVTIYCGDSPFSVSDHYCQDPQDVVQSIAMAGGAAFSPNLYPMAAETVFVISPEHARTFADAGWSKAEVAQRLFDASKRKVKEIRGGERSPFIVGMDGDDELSKWSSPEEIIIVVVGGPAGRFSAVLPPWVGYGLGSTMVTRAIEKAS